MSALTIALTKGRILEETLPLLASVGIHALDDIHSSRKLIFATNNPDLQLLILRGSDVPTYVRYGAADIGVTGKDTLLEYGSRGLYELLDLGIARCHLMTAAIKGAPKRKGRIKVATKYTSIARRFYAEQGEQADIISLYGAMELAPLMGLADEIVDIVDTGNTLRANGLEPRLTIAAISSRIIVNKAAFKMKHAIIKPLIQSISIATNDNSVKK